MAIDILRHTKSTDIMSDCKELAGIEAFMKYVQDPEPGIPITPLLVYVVLLYSKDSFLNKKPIEDLRTRKPKAADYAGLVVTDQVRALVLSLGSEKVLDLIHGYLIHQNSILWTERCTLESQIEESHRIRLAPVSAEKDKDLLEAFNKKNSLTQHFSAWWSALKSYDAELFADHDDVKAAAKKKRITLESYVR